MTRLSIGLALLALSGGPVYAADMTDAELSELCVREMKSRQPADEVQSNTELVASHVERQTGRIVVDIQVTEAEGRRVAARCIVRDNRVFDFKG